MGESWTKKVTGEVPFLMVTVYTVLEPSGSVPVMLEEVAIKPGVEYMPPVGLVTDAARIGVPCCPSTDNGGKDCTIDELGEGARDRKSVV